MNANWTLDILGLIVGSTLTSNMDTLLVFMIVTMTTQFNPGSSQPGMPVIFPFFYQCNYHGNQDQSTLGSGEVTLTMTLKGQPEFYIPGNPYEG